jgi:hypothetical protein
MSRRPIVTLNRRAVVSRFMLGGAATAIALHGRSGVDAQEATPASGQCVAFAPPTTDGVGLVDLLLNGVIYDMPAGPVAISISRFTVEPGVTVPAEVFPFPALMYIETGESACPGEAGRIVYGPDGSVLSTSEGSGIQYVPEGTTQYIPGGIPDGAGNEGTTLMSSLVVTFTPAETGVPRPVDERLTTTVENHRAPPGRWRPSSSH